MLYFYSGTDRKKALAAVNVHVEEIAKGKTVLRISDANAVADLSSALAGGGMFESERVVVLSGTMSNDEMRAIVIAELPKIKASDDTFFIFEEKLDAATRKQVEKYAEKSEKFDAPAKKREGNIFALAGALRKGDKKSLWVNYQRELAADGAPEAIHGVLFWGAKDMLLKTRAPAERLRAEKLIAVLAELPHEARRRGEELEYALERFVLSGT